MTTPDPETAVLRHPPNATTQPAANGHLTITSTASGSITLDAQLATLWQQADGQTMTTAAQQPNGTESLLALRLAGLLLPPIDQTPTPPPIPNPAPLVSVIIVTRNGRHHLAECLPTLAAQTYPHLETIIVDDASTDGTAAYLHTHFPTVRVISQPDGPNFAAGCNLGAAHAHGDYLFFVNNDTALAPTCIQHLVAAHGQDPQTAGAAAMLRLHSHPPFINGLGTGLRRFGFGYDIGLGNLDVGQFDDVTEVPALCFGAALVSRAAWQQVGPLDERYQFYYEDADWSYRARLLGLRLAAAPHALVYHKFSASMNQQPSSFKIRLATRNRLWFVAKNFPATAVPAQLIRYGLDDIARLMQALRRGQWPLVAAIPQAWGQYLRGLPATLTARKELARPQRINFWQTADTFPPPIGVGAAPILTSDLIATRYRPHLQKLAAAGGTKPQRLLIISPDAVHSSMGGVGIRYWELAQQLANAASVTLAVPQPTDLTSDQVAICQYEEGNEATLRPLAATADIILLSGFTAYHHPFLRQHPAYKIIDLYDPMILENLERFANRPLPERQGLHNVGVNTFNQLFQMGDFFICASEKQRDYWLGALTAANRVNPTVYAADVTLRRLIDLVLFGLPATPPLASAPVLKGVRPGIGANDKVIIWGGGLWDWLDPLTVIAAMPAVLAEVPNARLFFLGTRHPNPDVPISVMAQRALALADELGLRDTAVFFNEWTPYLERVNYLCEADVGVSLHGDHIETRFAVRTRLMDYLWAGLPMVVGGGDVLSDLAERHGLGIVVAAGDKTAVANALITLLQNPVDAAAFTTVRQQFHWERVAQPLRAYVEQPWRNAGGGGETAVGTKSAATTSVFHLLHKATATLKQTGITGLWQETVGYLRWLMTR